MTPVDLTEAEIARDEAESERYRQLLALACPNCGLLRGGAVCVHCGSVKNPVRRALPPFNWADVVPMPPGVEARKTSGTAGPNSLSPSCESQQDRRSAQGPTAEPVVTTSRRAEGSKSAPVAQPAKPRAATRKTGTEGGWF